MLVCAYKSWGWGKHCKLNKGVFCFVKPCLFVLCWCISASFSVLIYHHPRPNPMVMAVTCSAP